MNTLCVKRPLLTEKTLALASRGWFTFVVDPKAAKNKIAHEVSTLYKVDVTMVRTLVKRGKERRVGRRMLRTRTRDTKKALVRLKAGQRIAAFEITAEEEKK